MGTMFVRGNDPFDAWVRLMTDLHFVEPPACAACGAPGATIVQTCTPGEDYPAATGAIAYPVCARCASLCSGGYPDSVIDAVDAEVLRVKAWDLPIVDLNSLGDTEDLETWNRVLP